MLRLAWLTENYPPARGGMAQSCDRIVAGLRGSGVEIDVFHLSPRLRRWEQRRQLRGCYFGCPVEGDPSHSLNRLWSTLESQGVDYTHVVAFGGTLPLLAGPVFAAWLRRPLITLIRGNDFDAGVFNPRKAGLLRDAFDASAQICCVSWDKVRKILALHPRASVCWIPNGIDTAAWQAQAFDRERAEQWQRRFVPPERRVLGFFGHLKAKKGLLFFLDTLLRSGLQAHFHLLLVGDLTPEAVDWLEQREDRLSVTPLPFLDRYDLIPYLLASDFAVLPSFYDGMPNVMLEAMALGVPLLASSAGGMGDVLEDGVHGYLFDPGDFHGCRRALSLAAGADGTILRAFGRACGELVGERLRAVSETAAYLRVLQQTRVAQSPVGESAPPVAWRTNG